jgi:hypothetical protein
MGNQKTPLRVSCPLREFMWAGDRTTFGSDVELIRQQTPDLDGLELQLSQDELESVRAATHWLNYQVDEGGDVSSSEIANLVLVSLWLVHPSHSQIAFRFEIGDQSRSRVRMLDRFQVLPGIVYGSFSDSEILQAASYFPILLAICKARGRLNNALVMTCYVSWARHWQPSLMASAAALEALLTYSKDRGLTERLAITYACVTHVLTPDRDVAFREFKLAYSTRSDVVHGRIHSVKVGDRFPMLEKFQSVLRVTWTRILSDQSLMDALEGDDSVRRVELVRRIGSYVAPP